MVERKIDNLDAIGSSPIVLNIQIQKNKKRVFRHFWSLDQKGEALFAYGLVAFGSIEPKRCPALLDRPGGLWFYRTKALLAFRAGKATSAAHKESRQSHQRCSQREQATPGFPRKTSVSGSPFCLRQKGKKMTEYVGVLLYIAIAVGLGIVILFRSYKVRPRRLDLEKATAYECGFEPFGEARSPFDIGFYLVAILFQIFDIEVAFQLPWVLGGISTGSSGFFAFLLFQVVLTIGFVFEWQKGALEWSSFVWNFLFAYGKKCYALFLFLFFVNSYKGLFVFSCQ